MDTEELLRASDVIPDYELAKLERTRVLEPGEKVAPFATDQGRPVVTREVRESWGDFAVWDIATGGPAALSRDDIGEYFHERGVEPALEGTFEVLIGGKPVPVRTVFDLVREHLRATWSLENVTKVTWAPASAVRSLARGIAANPEHVLFITGMGPNQMFNADQKDRAVFLVAALTRNVGFLGGNVGSYAGNYRASYFNGMPLYMAEDPFDPELDPKKMPRVRNKIRMQSAHFYSHGDSPLVVNGRVFNGESHMPLPTKSLWFSGSNSLLGNAKGHYDVVMNLLRHPAYRAKNASRRMIDAVIVNEWWWTGSCEYADVVFGVDSWGEYNVHDITNSCTNPFMQVMPLSPLPRLHNTRSDTQTYAGVAAKLAEITGDRRFEGYWAFIENGKGAPYIQRILDHSNITRGYRFEDLLEKAEKGVPAMMMGRSYPKFMGYEQSVESMPWYNRTGRLEFLRDEPEFKMHGEMLPLHREPVDATFHEPNAIVAAPHPLIHPQSPQELGIEVGDRSGEARQVRNVVLTPDELLKTRHPLMAQGFTHQWITPKYRHSVHTIVADIDILSARPPPALGGGGLRRHQPGRRARSRHRGRRLRADPGRSSGPALPRLAGAAQGGQGRQRDDAGPLLPGHASGRRAYLLPLLRRVLRKCSRTREPARRPGPQSGDRIPIDVSLREPPERHPLVAAAHAAHRHAQPQGPDGPDSGPGVLSRRALRQRRAEGVLCEVHEG
jgi:nitrate reductase alpha subunit